MTTREEHEVILSIATRAQRMYFDLGVERDRLDWIMDIEAAHMDTPLKLEELRDADDFNFSHDVGGIMRHLNRDTGEIENCFVPRFAQPE